MKIIESTDIFNDNVNRYLDNEFKQNSEYIYLSATNNVFNHRKSSPYLSIYFKNKNQVFVSEAFENFIAKEIRISKGYIPLVDMYYILKKVIDNYFEYDNGLKISYQNMYYKLFELYKLLMFYDIDDISNKFIDHIEKEYSKEYSYIFDIYNAYKSEINKIVKYINESDLEQISYKNEKLGLDLFINKDINSCFDTFIQKQKREIRKQLSKINTVYFDGFISFNDLDKYIIYNAIELGKEVVFITRELSNEYNSDFLINNVYGYNLNVKNIDIINLSINTKGCNKKTSINYIRKNFYNPHPAKDEENLINDGHINFVMPFVNKTDELKYITGKISELIKNECVHTSNIEDIKKFIKDNILIVCAVDKELMARYLDDHFSKIGIFVFNGTLDTTDKREINLETLKSIYFDISDFLEEEILYNDGTKLNLSEKKLLFNRSFYRIQVPAKNNILSASPVLEFIFQIYDISKNKINISKFKSLLFSNWYYHIGKSELKWDTLLGAFEQIKIYFEGKDTLDDWIKEVNIIINLRKQIDNNELYKFHPFNAIEENELVDLLQVMKSINYLSKEIENVCGSFDKHIAFLRDNIISNEKIFNDDSQLLTDAQKVIRDFCKILDTFISDSTIQNCDSEFFGKHLRNIIDAFNISDSDNKNNFNVNFQNMLNLKHYKYVFFMGLEADKYPRKHKRKFPFTNEIIEIIRMLGIKSYDIDIYDSNITMERFFFKNVLDFVDDSIWFTCTRQQTKKENSFSLYAEDIASSFNSELDFIIYDINTNGKLERRNYSPSLYIKPKDAYTLKELVTFQLCPKLYYHLYVNNSTVAYINKNQLRLYAEAVMYSDLFCRFMEYNYDNKKWYFSGSKEVYNILDNLSNISFNTISKYFDCLRVAELNSIKERVTSRIIRIIDDYILNKLNYNQYTVVKSKGKNIQCNNFNLLLEYDTAIFSNKKGSRKIDQNRIYLDFLTLKCTSRDVEEKHYKDMINLLHKNNKYIDRVFFANRIISKINVQFDSGIEKFIFGNDGGIERVCALRENILKTDFLNISPYSSNFCDYCILSSICMGGKQMQEKLEVKE